MTEKAPNKRPVILQVLPSLRTGGVERGTIEVARAITKAGWRAIVASGGGPLVPALTHAGAEHIQLPLDTKNPFRINANSKRIEALIKAHKVDIVHARSRAPAWSAHLAAKRTDAHFVTTFHGIYGLQNDFKRRYNAIMTRGERVIAVSHFVARHIKENYFVDPENVRVIHRGVDLRVFNPGGTNPQRMIELMRAWHLPEHLPVILFPGRITRWKGQHIFIRALAGVPHRNFMALLMGDDTGHERYHQELEDLIKECGLEGHVRMVEPTQSMPEAYTLARFVVSTSVEPEAFGRVVLEAQAMGRPVIATNHGGPRETVVPEVTGWLIEPGSVTHLTHALTQALSMSDEAHTYIGAQAIAQARQFSSDVMCDRTLAVYQELLN